jgi:ribonucleoside-triphosphate reductase (thioredoxin)
MLSYNTSLNGMAKHVKIPTEVKKRDSRLEALDKNKIVVAIEKCCKAGGENEEVSKKLAEEVTESVINILKAEKLTTPVDVEHIQRLVIQQLWAAKYYDGAERYTIYREERRKDRERRPIPPEVVQKINEDSKYFPTPLQAYQFYSKFARWREEDQRRETWVECNERVFDWFGTLPAFHLLTQEEVTWLKDMMLNLKASPALRVVQMAGPALIRDNIGVYNCTYAPIVDLFSFAELLYILMQGCGGAYSVESYYIDDLPKVKKQKDSKVVHEFIVPDTTEGWCDALYFGLQKWFSGEDVKYDYYLIRKAGTRLKTKGGTSSGSGPLRDLLDFARNLILKAQGRQLTDLEVHDLCCMIGHIVQVGGVRRAALLCLSDLDSVRMRQAKHADWYVANRYRSMANISTAYDEKPSVEVFMEEFIALMKSGSGERGYFNRKAVKKHKPRRRKDCRFGTNACQEINQRPFGCCNLTMSIARETDSEEELINKIQAATYFGVLQSTATDFKYVRKEWSENCIEERLLGVDLMGHMDHPLLKPGASNREELVKHLKNVVAETAKELSSRFGINYSAANTCGKPGGDSSVLFNSTTMGGSYSQYQIRRTRESIHSPVCKFLKDAGVPWEPAMENEEGLVAFAWPKKNADGCTLRDDMTAIQQLENWLFWKQTWSEHSISCTIMVKEHEWPAVGAWVWEHFDDITGVSFLPWDSGNYRTVPNEVLTKEQYEDMEKNFPKIDWSKLLRYEDTDQTEGSRTIACSAGFCEGIKL